MSAFLTAALVTAGAGLAGSVYGSNKAADAAEAANSGDLPEWLKPYMTGNVVPDYLKQNPKLNTNWLDYITQLGEGNYESSWQPMSNQSPFFNPDQTFTPEPGGGPYGQLPPGMQQPPPQQTTPGRTVDDIIDDIKRKYQDEYQWLSQGAAPLPNHDFDHYGA